jgi:two-component system phosphate regulon sensor histidine kinase PhoR
MGFELSKNESPEAAHAAILDFGFGEIVLNLLELKPQWITNQVSLLKNWYFAIVTVVLIATIMAMASLWRNLSAQVKLARKKDDFISAVSHELRTPLTTIRMYTEMLENNWIKTDEKRTEYYGIMRQESERLTRLVENVLDFSRIQRGKKRYNFTIGNINQCITDVVEMMTPCAFKQDFQIETSLQEDIQSTSFDTDAVMQIVINLIDNAIKYAGNSDNKTITVTTRTNRQFILIEVSDHGPGIPHTQRKKIFDEFYRIGEESKRETTGTGLGLALVKRFANAHNGFVEALSAKPNGALLRVAIAINN